MTTKSSRHRMVESTCEWCGIVFPARKDRVDKGQSRWCSRPHYQEWLAAQGSQRKNIGKENALVSWSSEGFYKAYWYEENGKYTSTTWARWAWELNFGEIPDGYRAGFKDGDSSNNVVDNLCLQSSDEFGEKLSKISRGRVFTEEHKQALRDGRVGIKFSEEHKSNMGKATRKMWESGVFDSPETRAAYSRQGSATKGSKRTEEQKRRMSESRKGRASYKRTPEIIAKLVKSLTGRKSSDEAKKKISDAMKGRIVTPEHRLNLSKALRGVYTGRLASGYKDGKSIPAYPADFGAYTKSYIRRRDNDTCQSCGEDVKGKRKGHVHHIDNDKRNTAEDNLILLCVPCHQSVHGKNSVSTELIEYLKTRLTR